MACCPFVYALQLTPCLPASAAITSRLTASKSAIDGYSGLRDRITELLHETLDTLDTPTAQNLRKMITIYCGSEMTTKDAHTFISSFSLVHGDEIERMFLAELGLNNIRHGGVRAYHRVALCRDPEGHRRVDR